MAFLGRARENDDRRPSTDAMTTMALTLGLQAGLFSEAGRAGVGPGTAAGARELSPKDETTFMDEASFQKLYDRTARQLRGYLTRVCGNQATADDLLQESYLRLLRARFEPQSDEHLKNYLFTIATNLTRDRFRRMRWAEVPLPALAGGGDHDRRVQLRTDVRDLMGQLKPRDRRLLWLGHVERFSHKEIGEILGVKPQSVRLMMFRARKRFAALLEQHGVGPEVLS